MALLPKTKQVYFMFQQLGQHIYSKEYYDLVQVAHTCNPRYLGGIDL
jgi:hypothetical protein